MMDSKPWYDSKTIWLQIITVIIVAITAIVAQEGLVSPTTAKWMVVAESVLNAIISVALRPFSTAPLTLK